jgi:ankyrin repeat protein
MIKAAEDDFEKFLSSESKIVNNFNLESQVIDLHFASQMNDLNKVRQLLQQNINVNAVSDDGWTALHFAAFKGYNEVARALLDAKINPNIQGKIYNRTALHYAVDRENVEMVKLILSYNPNVTLRDKSNKTPLDIAKQKGLTEIAEMIEEYCKH